jgi:hypothetical protein
MTDFKRTIIVPGPKVEETAPAISVDDAIKSCLVSVKRIVDKIGETTSRGGIPDRNTVMTLKDCLSMLFEAKKKEDEIMADLSETELEKMLKK